MVDRRVWSWGALGAVAIMATTAMVVDAEIVDVHFAQPESFDIVVSGSRTDGWQPGDADWEQGNPEAYNILLNADGSNLELGPGGQMTLRIAAKNASPGLPGLVALSMSDPDDRSGQTDPDTGAYLELYDQLRFTILENGTPLVSDVAAADLVDGRVHDWSASWAAGEVHILDVTIALPHAVDDRWQGAMTDVQFRFEAIND